MSEILSLERMAQTIEEQRREVRQRRARYDEVREPYESARAALFAAEEKLKQMIAGMDAAKTAHAVEQALAAKGIETDEPRVIPVEVYGGRLNYFVLTAVEQNGTGLYLHTPERSHRYQGKEYAIRGADPTGGYGPMKAAGLRLWQERGSGQFGAGTGSVKPKKPPGGGRWRWIKVEKQRELTAAS